MPVRFTTIKPFPAGTGQGVGAGTVTVGIDFRATSSYVTDPTGYTFNGGGGWEIAPTGARDRSRSVDHRLAGIVFVLNRTGDTGIYAVTVPPGIYDLRLALGDATGVQRQNCILHDGPLHIADVAIDHGTLAGTFIDATGIVRSAAAWPTENQPLKITLETGTLRVSLGNAESGLYSSTIASLSLAPPT